MAQVVHSILYVDNKLLKSWRYLIFKKFKFFRNNGNASPKNDGCFGRSSGCLFVHQPFFHNDMKNFGDVGGGILGCRGFH
ncbi:Argonaute/Dicer protein, PAZ [Artemisia annua]|uniref:Argonaute/Dicer protein, PAZ n=1 Tax=Artemisia annua TaxID=35608 RepID=A0A2U1PLW1_ARTAN|nr:Argonaute/Dicer protein, PAZ [Artemisia annua]